MLLTSRQVRCIGLGCKGYRCSVARASDHSELPVSQIGGRNSLKVDFDLRSFRIFPGTPKNAGQKAFEDLLLELLTPGVFARNDILLWAREQRTQGSPTPRAFPPLRVHRRLRW